MLEPLTSFLAARCSQRADIPILQPADQFLESAGEDLRRRIFLTETIDGSQQCLRPEFTIPICLHHARNRPPARYAYGGTVFRQTREGAAEFEQVGLEDLGNADAARADADALADALDALAECGLTLVDVTLGDQALFNVVVENLALPRAIAARLVRNFGNPAQLKGLIEQLTRNGDNGDVANGGHRGDDGAGHKTIEKMALAQDAVGLVAHIEEKMAAAGLSSKVGRSPEDIARRAIAKAAEGQFQLEASRAEILRGFLDLVSPLDFATAGLKEFAKATGIDFADALAAFEERSAHLSVRGVNVARMVYRASFGRNLEYYTGMLFEASVAGAERAVAGGGRYDSLCTLLGSEIPVPAVGFSISLDRVAEAGGKT